MEQIEKVILENKMLKQLLEYGKIYVNYDSSDCDGGHSGGYAEFNSLDEMYEWWESNTEWADGPFGFSVASPNNLQESYTYFTR